MPPPARVRRSRARSHLPARSVAGQFGRYLRTETVGGAIMLAATVVALVWANSGWSDSYTALRETTFGPSAWHLDLDLQTWATDGLLAVFFFVAGLELKRELVTGELRTLRKAMLPVFAAAGGIIVPALICVAISAGVEGAGRAWAVPMATDIAFALAVLALTASRLPRTVRLLLLGLAVVDDLGAILIIAIVFTDDISLPALLIAAALVAAYAGLQRLRVQGTWSALLYVPLAIATWVAVHESGVHATVAGVALGLATRVRADRGERHAPAVRLEHRLQPWSAGVALPLFAFFAAGVPLSGDALSALFADRVAWAIMLGLVVGKTIGVFGGAFLATKLGLATLPRSVVWYDVAALAVLAGVGFTVALLMSELAFADDAAADVAKTAVLLASTFAAVLGAVMLRLRVRRHPHARPPRAGSA